MRRSRRSALGSFIMAATAALTSLIVQLYRTGVPV